MYVCKYPHTDFNMHLHLPIHRSSREAAPDPDLLGDALVEGEEAASVTYAGVAVKELKFNLGFPSFCSFIGDPQQQPSMFLCLLKTWGLF